jgi:murein DD-endopeptidase / murein LD-carboxypeptidase
MGKWKYLTRTSVNQKENGLEFLNKNLTEDNMNKIFLFVLVLVSMTTYSLTKKQLGYFDTIPKYTTDSTLNSFIIHWMGKPYKLGGTTEKGIDCSQFNKRLANDVFNKSMENTCATQWKTTTRIKKDSLQIGDIVFFSSKYSPSRWHCGTYIGDDMFVHAANKNEGVKISSLNEPKYKLAYKGAGKNK